MAWLVELANTDHSAELNIGTVCLVSVFSYYMWAIFVQTVLKILHRKLWIEIIGLYPPTLSWCFLPVSIHMYSYYLSYPNSLTSCLSIYCFPSVLHQMLELEPILEAACNRQVKKILSNRLCIKTVILSLVYYHDKQTFSHRAEYHLLLLVSVTY